MSESGKKPATDTTQMKLTATDPVCGMIVDPATARGVARYQGDTYCFCSPACMHRFTAEPSKYLAPDYKPAMPAAGSSVQISPPARAAHKDPVCGMTVDASKAAASLEHDGKLYHFCCKGCAVKFKADPSKYLSPSYKPGGMQQMVQLGGMQMAPTVKQERDPVCGMDVDPAKPAAKLIYAGVTYYFCCSGCADKFGADPQKYLSPRPKPSIATAKTPAARGVEYVCPMDPEVRQIGPGACPKCGMALEPDVPLTASRTTWTCPMHPEIVRDGPGACPICGMALEPQTVTAQSDDNPELRDMTRRFWSGVLLGVPLIVLSMAHMVGPLAHAISPRLAAWIEFALATPIVLWAGWPFFQRGWASVKFRSPNMFTLIAMGVGVAYVFSAVATLVPQIFPEALRGAAWSAGSVLRGSGCNHRPGASGAGLGAEGAQPYQRCNPRVAGPRAQDGAHYARRWQRIRHSARSGADW